MLSEMAIEAGRIRARRYHREQPAVSLADCITAASALAGRQPLATADRALANVVRAEGETSIRCPTARDDARNHGSRSLPAWDMPHP